jgi:hypothetical protein
LLVTVLADFVPTADGLDPGWYHTFAETISAVVALRFYALA